MTQSPIPMSPYYLHPGENLGLILVLLSLNETNYTSWSKKHEAFPFVQKQVEVIDRSIKTLMHIDPLYEL